MSGSSTAIRLNSVVKAFGAEVVFPALNLEVASGSIVCVVGKSGCGKSTLLNILAGVESITAGSMTVAGTTGYVAQRDLLLSWRTVLENVLLPAELRQTVSSETVARARALFQLVELAGHERKYPDAISGGMRQKAALVRTLLQPHEIFLFDEPFSAIDFDARLRLNRELRRFLKSTHKTAVFVTHNIEEAISFGDRILVFGRCPLGIVDDAPMQIEEEFRDPVAVRGMAVFHELFARIWRAMGQ